ncbi:hypothetical protein SSP24_23700 [Streptomyces spinoverrucosus]|uniref:DUF3558 domain-containing protein n=1 Tax=Streptomyces spinoverrucosus TaxID=284043 RepID=A0A4Y3VEN8_9ACTN|nr:DUF3558 domain-containing protein [Streptomyces spinoverrucosus]GEC04715.1 hypothetical protein SSP24_23700 [Streptomyces spinoverrucosus]GHB59134.1 hypothetical protein GCM10010397_31540 [Streptomyces spinoverrucosus]
MQRKAYVTGVAALLAALLAGCTSGSDGGDTTDSANSDNAGTATAAAEPGRYRNLPEPCGAVGEDTLDSLLPGLQQIADEEQREQAYQGKPTLTYDNDRKVGCRWKVESSSATDHLFVDFERVVSYDNTVSDDDQAQELFAGKQEAADLPEPTPTETITETATDDGTESPSGTATPSATTTPQGAPSGTPSGTSSPTGPTSSATPTALQPRVLDDLADEAFLDDELSSSGSTAKQRTVTVAFRTSNVIVTIEYEEQPATVGVVPDSKEMQDRARKLAAQLADSLAE